MPVMANRNQPASRSPTFRDGKVIETVHYAGPEDAFAAAGLRA